SIGALKREVGDGRNPRDAKVLLAQEIVERFHGAIAAERALTDFEARFRHGAIPENLPEVHIDGSEQTITVAQAMKQAGLTSSTSEAWRMIDQGGVRIDGQKVTDRHVSLARHSSVVIQVGKRKFARVYLD
ncbi:MAG TPA: S4 domain-containing protein, partial [Accumulibacter sp.]|nr:S4 domain-containing protein [Accumulibacter sp.]